MYQVIIAVEDREQADAVAEVVQEAEDNGDLLFAFNTEIREVKDQ